MGERGPKRRSSDKSSKSDTDVPNSAELPWLAKSMNYTAVKLVPVGAREIVRGPRGERWRRNMGLAPLSAWLLVPA